MNRRILTIVSCALVLSVCASYLVYRAVASRPANTAQTRTVPVVVAARDLNAGSLIGDIDLRVASWAGPVPKGAIDKTNTALNRGVTAPIFEGEPVTEARLTPRGAGGGLAGTIPPGMRACAVKVNEVAGVAGFAVPGMRVDVLVTGVPLGAGSADGPQVRTLLENIQVLSAGTDFQKDQAGKPQQAQVVNLLVTPRQAEILSLAGNEMHLQLVLRNPVDTAILKPEGALASDLFGGHDPGQVSSNRQPLTGKPARSDSGPESPPPTARPPAVQAAAAPEIHPASALKPYTVDVMNGSIHSVAQFSPLQVQP
jgi:pilus assembly protein CpaB